MIYGSVCSGIEAASVAWMPLGWTSKWFSEIDPFCCDLLKQRYPDIVNLGSITNVTVRDGPIDVLVGGTPCQAFSVVGKRMGLDDPRGNLTLEYLRCVESLRPRWFVWENVPGVLSVGRGYTFGWFVTRLAQLGFGFAWRVLDSRYFGIPQRRRRVFVVGHLGGGWRKAAQVLFDRRGYDQNASSLQEVRQVDTCPIGWTGDPTPKYGIDICPTLRSQQGGEGVGFICQGRMARFTAREWERLMGLPDDYTKIEFKGREASPKQRMKVIGNSFPVPILHWIAQKIEAVDPL